LSSDFVIKLGRFRAVAAMALVAGMLSACQVRPLYSENSAAAGKLASVSFSDPASRVGQEVRNRLVFFTGHGAGEPAKVDYNTDLTVTSAVTDVLLVRSSDGRSFDADTSRAGRVTVTANYILRRASDGQVIKAGSRTATSLVDFSQQEFAKLRAIRDAENRAARETAELVGADLAAALGR
jgi:LPS-assembly lipoprotein